MDNNRPANDRVRNASTTAHRLAQDLPASSLAHVERHEFLGMTAIVASASMRRLLTICEKVAKTESPVLITGESGTGKELVARAIHHYSGRGAGPFVDVNCAALPENLIESELFGYDKGAFSGAEKEKPGLFETACSGTIFLDEIGEMDTRMQAKLLRILDGQPYYRLGSARKTQAECRVIAATNLDLEQAVRSGKFRKDLFHRLDVYHLRVPALRERVPDIVPLVDLFLQGRQLTAEAVKVLEEYSWPGNIRELRNVLNKAALFSDGKIIDTGDLPAGLFAGTGSAPQNEYLLDGAEQQLIMRALSQTAGHQQKAADLLGISRRTLIRKLKVYRLGSQVREAGA